MKRLLPLVAAALAWFGSPAFGQRPDRPPAGPPPLIAIVVEMAADRGELICEQTAAEQVPVTKIVTVEKEGVVKQIPVTTLETRNITSRTKHQLKQCEFYSVAGKKLTDEEARKRLTAGSIVLVAAGRTPADAYLKVLRDDVLILVSTAPVVPPTTPPPPPPGVKPLPVERNR
jgi:hypothetical protein